MADSGKTRSSEEYAALARNLAAEFQKLSVEQLALYLALEIVEKQMREDFASELDKSRIAANEATDKLVELLEAENASMAAALRFNWKAVAAVRESEQRQRAETERKQSKLRQLQRKAKVH